ncbi:MAG TPA: hypothetical protein VGM99_01130 [Candidatus Cybelea sp.]|jgi:hypothetical protein
MTWESVIALATVAQVLLLGAAAAVALVQMRHLRRQNDLAAFLEMMKVYNSPELRRARAFVTDELEERLRDPEFRHEIVEGRGSAEHHPERVVLTSFATAGLMSRLVTWDLIVRFYLNMAPSFWTRLLPVIALMRTRVPYAMVSFQELVTRCRAVNEDKLRAQDYARMPNSLRPMWAETQREVERAYAGVMTSDQTNDDAE